MRLYLVIWPEGWGDSSNPQSLFVSGTVQWQAIQRERERERELKLHLAERDPQHHAWPKRGVEREHLQLRILLSYWYYKNVDLDALFAKYFSKPYPDVFADSGAFSAQSQGVSITCREYADWVKRWQHLFSVYANLDVIGNTEATWNNQCRLEGMDLAPLPVFHTGSDWAELERLIDLYPYIALGGMVPYMRYTDKIMPFLIKAFRMAEGKTVFHGFGATSWVVLKSLPWYSVDSSSWGQGFRYGQVPLFDEKRGRFVNADLGNRVHWKKHSKLVRSLGFNPLDFADRSRNDRAKICAISALSYMKAERWLRKRHGEIQIPRREDEGAVLRLHLADANPNRYAEAVGASGLRLHLSDTSSGINFGDADKGVKIHLAESVGGANSKPDIATAMEVLR